MCGLKTPSDHLTTRLYSASSSPPYPSSPLVLANSQPEPWGVVVLAGGGTFTGGSSYHRSILWGNLRVEQRPIARGHTTMALLPLVSEGIPISQ